MKFFAAFALVASVAALPQQSSGSDCQDSRDGSFAISVVNVTDSSSGKRSVVKRQLSGILTLNLKDGVLKDQAGREGYIASNHQFQFDQPIQDGALEKSGFSVCSNGTIALDGNAVWYQCYSGGFYNLYDEAQGKQCNQIYIYAQSSTSSSQTGAVSQASDGQPAASTQVPAPAVSQLTDGQPQAPTSQGTPEATSRAPVVSQISDGQPQAPTSQAPAPTSQAPAPVVSQISDGQPQAPESQESAPVVSQISDGQPQVHSQATAAPEATTAAPSGAVVSQISDGQPQVHSQVTATPEATTAAPSGAVVSQISDGQPQVPTGVPSVVAGAGNYSSNGTTPPNEFAGGATTPTAAFGALVAGLMAMAAML